MKRQPTAARQSQIVDVALHILAHKGARQLTAQLLANAIGITAGAIFRHFATMDEVLDAVVDRMETALFADFPPEAPTPFERLRLFFERRALTVATNPDIARVLLTDHLAHAGDTTRAARIMSFKRRSQGFVMTCLEQAKAQQQICADIGVDEAAVLIMGAIMALSQGGPHGPGGSSDSKSAEVTAFAERVWMTIERALQTPTPLTRAQRKRSS